MRRHKVHAVFLLIATILLLGFSQAVLAKGPPNKVTVDSAEPPEATQGIEETVYVNGAGFDDGSEVSFLVTGTTDASQVDVLQVEYVSPSQLKARIRPKETALVTDYDIEVRTLSGRKGKGTTLFRVKQATEECTGSELTDPEIVYMTGFDTNGEISTKDIYLSSISGCDRYLLLENAVQMVSEVGSDPKDVTEEYLTQAADLRLDVEGSTGVVTWRDRAILPVAVYELRFNILEGGGIEVDPDGPKVIYAPPGGFDAYAHDSRINETGKTELVIVERYSASGEWRLAFYEASNGRISLGEGMCPFEDNFGECFWPSYTKPWWNEDGTSIYLNPNSTPESAVDYVGLAEIARTIDGWLPAVILMKHESQVSIIGIPADGLLAYEWLHYTPRKNGRTSFKDTYWVTAVIDPKDCLISECLPEDGDVMAADADKFPRGWTRDGGLLFRDIGPGDQRNIRIYSNPFTGEVGQLFIENYDGNSDTTF